MRKAILYTYSFLLALLAGGIAAGQALGFARIYYPGLVAVASVLLAAGAGLILVKSAGFLDGLLSPAGLAKSPAWFEAAGYAAGLIILLAMLALPLALWPYTPVSEQLTWDAGLYHLPKAAELIVSHSSWDLSIAYGEYPLGYELLIAASLLLSRGGFLIGPAHALIVVFFTLSFFLLLCRYSHLPRGALFFGAAFLVASYDLMRAIDSNPFQVLRLQAFVIGKNDFFMGAAILALLLFSPVGLRENARRYSLAGMALASLLAVSAKPNGLPIVALVWLLALVYEVAAYRRARPPWQEIARRWSLPLTANLIGSLWAVRNLIGEGALVSRDSLAIQQFSILNNLTNPYLYNYLDLYLKQMLGLFGLTVLLAFAWKQIHWSIPLAFGTLILAFAATPASAFFGSTQAPSQVAWRLGIYALAFEAPAALAMLDPLAGWIVERGGRPLAALLSLGMLACSLWGAYASQGRLHLDPARAIVLRDQFAPPVGANGYYSAYDYVQKNVRNSVVWVENGMPYYVFGPGLTNSISRARPADYLVIFRTAEGYPDSLGTADFAAQWSLVYEDSRGRVYQRK